MRCAPAVSSLVIMGEVASLARWVSRHRALPKDEICPLIAKRSLTTNVLPSSFPFPVGFIPTESGVRHDKLSLNGIRKVYKTKSSHERGSNQTCCFSKHLTDQDVKTTMLKIAL